MKIDNFPWLTYAAFSVRKMSEFRDFPNIFLITVYLKGAVESGIGHADLQIRQQSLFGIK